MNSPQRRWSLDEDNGAPPESEARAAGRRFLLLGGAEDKGKLKGTEEEDEEVGKKEIRPRKESRGRRHWRSRRLDGS